MLKRYVKDQGLTYDTTTYHHPSCVDSTVEEQIAEQRAQGKKMIAVKVLYEGIKNVERV